MFTLEKEVSNQVKFARRDLSRLNSLTQSMDDIGLDTLSGKIKSIIVDVEFHIDQIEQKVNPSKEPADE